MPTLKELDEEAYEELLTEIYGTVKVGNLEWDAGSIVREMDPIAFRCGMAEEPEVWLCDECGAEYETEQEAKDCEQDDL